MLQAKWLIEPHVNQDGEHTVEPSVSITEEQWVSFVISGDK